MRSQIKICGIQCKKLAFQAAEAGADYIGLVCVPDSKRFVSAKQLPDLVDAIHQGGAQAVLVVKDAKEIDVQCLLAQASFDMIQLHGNYALNLPKMLPRMYATTAQSNPNQYPAIDIQRDFLIIDHHQSGSGQTFCWKTFAPPDQARWFLAGGLTDKNVAVAIQKFSPFAVDVSSGVEDELGIKQLAKMKTFIKACSLKEKEK